MLDPPDDGGLIDVHRILEVHHVDAGEQAHGEENVHGRAGNGDDETMPARVGEELGGIAGALIHGVLAAHFYVAAERKGGEAVVGVSTLEAEKALAEADGKDFDTNAEELGRGIVAKLVNQDHETQN